MGGKWAAVDQSIVTRWLPFCFSTEGRSTISRFYKNHGCQRLTDVCTISMNKHAEQNGWYIGAETWDIVKHMFYTANTDKTFTVPHTSHQDMFTDQQRVTIQRAGGLQSEAASCQVFRGSLRDKITWSQPLSGLSLPLWLTGIILPVPYYVGYYYLHLLYTWVPLWV